jgi:hypothetical protein
MNQRESDLFSKQHDAYLIAAYSPELYAAGYSVADVERLGGPDVFMLATKIRTATEKEARAKFRTVRGVFEDTDFVACLKSMSKREKEEIRQRLNFLPTPR